MRDRENIRYTEKNKVAELHFFSVKEYDDPFNEITLDVSVRTSKGEELAVPAFWMGGDKWGFRYASPIMGEHKFTTICSDQSNTGLHHIQGTVIISEYTGTNPLYKHGPISLKSDNRHFEHRDGTPFLWLGDTWWSALTKRCKWPELFKRITKDRAGKGFSVIQLVAGLYPQLNMDSECFEGNEAGIVWDRKFNSINPYYFDQADLKIDWLVESGIVPCVFGTWGYYLLNLGAEKIKNHWRYLIARWGAYPVIWCPAGEAQMPYYSVCDGDRPEVIEKQRQGWNEVTSYIRSLDPFKRLLTIHPSPGDGSWTSGDILKDPELYDFEMLQTSHWGRFIVDKALEVFTRAYESDPEKPVLNGEVCYEGLLGTHWQDTQRFIFWSHMLSGAAGHTYGAEGIWNFNTGDYVDETGKHGEALWNEAMNFKGSEQVGLNKKFLEEFDWQRFEAHPEWISPHWDMEDVFLPYCAGIPGKVRIIYIPGTGFHLWEDFALKVIRVKNLESEINYEAYFFNPRTGIKLDRMIVKPDMNGELVLTTETGQTPCPSMEDWILIIEKV